MISRLTSASLLVSFFLLVCMSTCLAVLLNVHLLNSVSAFRLFLFLLRHSSLQMNPPPKGWGRVVAGLVVTCCKDLDDKVLNT